MEYVPVYYIQPFNRNAAALGYDLSSDPERLTSIEQARDTGQPVATAPFSSPKGRTTRPVFWCSNPFTPVPHPQPLQTAGKTWQDSPSLCSASMIWQAVFSLSWQIMH